MVAVEYLPPDANVLIVDDFLGTGKTLRALARIVKGTGAKLVGITVVVEKPFEGDLQVLVDAGFGHVPVMPLATIANMDDGQIVFAE